VQQIKSFGVIIDRDKVIIGALTINGGKAISNKYNFRRFNYYIIDSRLLALTKLVMVMLYVICYIAVCMLELWLSDPSRGRRGTRTRAYWPASRKNLPARK